MIIINGSRQMIRQHAVPAGSRESLADSLRNQGSGLSASGGSYDGQDHCSFSHPAIIPIHQPTRVAKEPMQGHLLDEAEREQQVLVPSLQEECYQVLVIAGPLFIEGMAAIGEQLVGTSCIGHLPDPAALSAMVLAQAIYNVSGYSIVSGLASALETLCGQAYGAGNLQLLPTFLVRAQLVCLFAVLPTALLWGSGYVEQLLTMMGQRSAIASPASRLLQLMLPSLLLSVVSETVMQYLLSQGIALPGMLAACLGLVASPLYNWGFVYWLHFGLPGAALAAAAIQCTIVLLVVGYLVYREGYQSTSHHGSAGNWRHFSFHSAAEGWFSYLSYGLPCLLFVTLEWWVWEVLVLLAGLLPDAETAVAVMGLSTQVSMLPWLCTYSLGTATATRIAQALGAGKAVRAARIFRVSCALVLLCSSGLCAAVWLLRDPLVAALTQSDHIQQELKVVLPVVVVAIICDGQVAVLNGMLRASGRQGKGAIINWASYWVLGLPVSYLLAFNTHWGVYGFRVGLMVAAACQALVLHAIAACRFDWDREVERAKELVGGEQLESVWQADGGSAEYARSGADTGRNEDTTAPTRRPAQGSIDAGVDDGLQEQLLPSLTIQG